jgi:hypothetical protein
MKRCIVVVPGSDGDRLLDRLAQAEFGATKLWKLNAAAGVDADPDHLDAHKLEALRSRSNIFDRLAFDPLTAEPMSLFREEGG